MVPLFMYMGLEKRISTYLEELFEEEMKGLFTVDIEKSKAGFRVFIDGDEGVNIDQCKEVSRKLKSMLEEDSDFFDHHMLEVSSPGADRPLSLWRQYPKHIGRKLKVTLHDGDRLEGKLKELAATSIILESGSGKKKKVIEVPFESISESIVQISFK